MSAYQTGASSDGAGQHIPIVLVVLKHTNMDVIDVCCREPLKYDGDNKQDHHILKLYPILLSTNTNIIF